MEGQSPQKRKCAEEPPDITPAKVLKSATAKAAKSIDRSFGLVPLAKAFYWYLQISCSIIS